MKKKCRVCGELKDESMFYRAKGNKDGLEGRCKSCTHKQSDSPKKRKARIDYLVSHYD